jgi:hypothetical protein
MKLLTKLNQKGFLIGNQWINVSGIFLENSVAMHVTEKTIDR